MLLPLLGESAGVRRNRVRMPADAIILQEPLMSEFSFKPVGYKGGFHIVQSVSKQCGFCATINLELGPSKRTTAKPSSCRIKGTFALSASPPKKATPFFDFLPFCFLLSPGPN